MAVSYERYSNLNDIEAAEDDLSLGSDDDPYNSTHVSPQTAAALWKQQRREVLDERWPWKIGMLQICWGLELLILGITEIVLPLTSTSLYGTATDITFTKQNLWGLGFLTGASLMVTGTIGLRSAYHRSITAVYLFFIAVTLDVCAYCVLFVLILISYTHGWTTKHQYEDVRLFYIHVCVSVSVCVALLLVLLAFLQYYEDVFCGDLQLCRRGLHCCVPCWCPRVVDPEELLDEMIRNRPPSLPI